MFYVVKFLVRLYFSILYSVHFEGKENIPNDTTVIYASNHRSNADPPLLGCGAKGKFAFMAKEELFKNKLFAWLIRSLGAFPVARGKGDTTVIDTSVERLDNGKNLMIFPEGTRSKDGKVGRGHTGAALISARSGKPIIPVGICYGDKLRFRTKITVKFGKPIDPAEYCEICDSPNPRQLVKLKNRYMADIKLLVEGEPEGTENVKEDESNE
ncbi:lysophospholipid acyltransferase family protein [Ruminococcus flavefaciens]|uniref:lysophospholipid acyltransferase family protein n=1 Tax=Ruminococcus flavefaciens TaxID=1265 RepID=UPI0026E9CCF6|nr:lysophospholipid acyltransferase family protein [Ruminococcus flavefaciens]MDD7517600.1 lysophospholipid acyltransferase family protein [Ruminococcus flavefaciens]MDY5690695.1 lysophospholipid acyltransferase family protein [Ruminococcus flavefaciens]